jgi:hypothetical protein
MRICIFSIVMLGILATGFNSHAQVEVVVPEAGRVKTTAKVENRILGVANSFTRRRGSARECVGACFTPRPPKPRPGCAVAQTATWIAPAASQLAVARSSLRGSGRRLSSSIRVGLFGNTIKTS